MRGGESAPLPPLVPEGREKGEGMSWSCDMRYTGNAFLLDSLTLG